MPAIPSFNDECFFVTPIGEEGTETRRRSDGVLNFIVAPAAGDLGLTAVRADQIAQPGQISLQVIEHVLQARAVVADLTDLNPNVFYEMAIRHTARLPVVLIAEKGQSLPFDIAQMRTIFFDPTDLASAADCREQISAHLNEALAGAIDSPVATAVNIQALQAGDQVERSVAELVSVVEDLAKQQRGMGDELRRVRREVRTPVRAYRLPERIFSALREIENLVDSLPAEEETTRALRLWVMRLSGDVQPPVRRLREDPEAELRAEDMRRLRPPEPNADDVFAAGD